MQDAHELPRISQSRPISQDFLIGELFARGYNILPGGICFGLTQMLIMEALAKSGGLEQYLQRLAKILYFIQAYGGIENYIARQEKNKIRATLENDLSTLKLINENLVEIGAFMDGIVLYQAPQLHHNHFLTHHKALHQSKCPAKMLLTPVNMENKGEIVVASAHFITRYTRDSFTEFTEKVKAHFNNTSFCIEINTLPHQSALVFDPEIGRLVLVDSNAYSLIWEKSDITEQVFNTLSNPKTCLLSLRVCVNSKHSKLLKKFCAKQVRPCIEDTLSELNGIIEISAFICYHIRAGNLAAIKAILADIKDMELVQQKKIIFVILDNAIANDFFLVLPILLPLILKPKALIAPPEPKTHTEFITKTYELCLSMGANKCAQYFLRQYPSLRAYKTALFFACKHPLSIELVLNGYNGNKACEKAALSYKNEKGEDALFFSVSNPTTFAILLKKYLEIPELLLKRNSLLMLQELIKYPRSLTLFLEAATANIELKQAVLYALEQGIFAPGLYYKGTLFRQALACPASFRALLAFSAQQNHLNEHAQLQESVESATPYLHSQQRSVPLTPTTRLIELFLTDRSMMRFILNCYALNEQLALLSLKIKQGQYDMPLYESDCFSEEFKEKIRYHLWLKSFILSKLPPLSLDTMFKEDNVDVPQEFVCLFDNALSDPEKFNELILSIPRETLVERVCFTIDGRPSLLMRSFSSLQCFEQLLIQLKDVLSDAINFELIKIALKAPAFLNIFLKHISPETLFQIISDEFCPYTLMLDYPYGFQAIWTKLHSEPRVSVATHGFFGAVSTKDADELESNQQGLPKNPGKVDPRRH